MVCPSLDCLVHMSETGPWTLLSDFEVDTLGLTTEDSQVEPDLFPPPWAVPVECGEDPDSSLNSRERRYIDRILTMPFERGVNTIIEAQSPIEVAGLEDKKLALYADFRDSAFRDRVWPFPPVRGPNGEAVIELKPGTEPRKLRPIQLAGARPEAMRSRPKTVVIQENRTWHGALVLSRVRRAERGRKVARIH